MAYRSLEDRGVELATFELLEQVASAGSLTAAAAAAGVSQQAASARLRRAERLLGVRLVERSVAGSSLSECGAMVLEWGTPLLEAARRTAGSLDALRARDVPLAVAASQTVAEFLLPWWLQAARTEGSDPALRLLSGNSADVVAAVRSGTAQIGFVETPDPPGDLQGVRIGLDELVVVVAPGHPWASGAPVAAADLAATGLLVRERGSGTRATLERWLAERGARIAAPAAELATTAAIRAAALAGAGPAVLSRLAVADDVVSGRLVRAAIEGPPIVRPLTALWGAAGLAPAARSFLDVVHAADRRRNRSGAR